jgi:hypothetical protein
MQRARDDPIPTLLSLCRPCLPKPRKTMTQLRMCGVSFKKLAAAQESGSSRTLIWEIDRLLLIHCGIFMCCAAALYVVGLSDKGQLSSLPRASGKGVSSFNSIEMTHYIRVGLLVCTCLTGEAIHSLKCVLGPFSRFVPWSAPAAVPWDSDEGIMGRFLQQRTSVDWVNHPTSFNRKVARAASFIRLRDLPACYPPCGDCSFLD